MPLIPLYNKDENVVAYARCDREDFKILNTRRWRLMQIANSALQYAVASRNVLMHREILKGVGKVDHRNRNGLDNRRRNLRPATHGENMQNRKKHTNGTTSPERGIHKRTGDTRWIAQVRFGGCIVFYKRFLSHDAAVRAVRCARKRFLPFARS